jgi:sulfoacetaldehyde dehydrogenase
MEFTVKEEADARAVVGDVVARARAAQSVADRWTQGQADEAAVAAGWAIVEPARNRA